MLSEKKEAPKPRAGRTSPKTDVADDFMAFLSLQNNQEGNDELIEEEED